MNAVKPELAVAEHVPEPITAKVAGQLRETVWLALAIVMLCATLVDTPALLSSTLIEPNVGVTLAVVGKPEIVSVLLLMPPTVDIAADMPAGKPVAVQV